MQYLTCQSIEIPRLGFGTWKLGGAECIAGVKGALDAGYRHIDTAQAYDNEEEVGAGIQSSHVSRHEVFLVTKIWRDHMGAESMRSSVIKSLKKLGTDYVDLLLLHWPVTEVPLEESLEALEGLCREGFTRLIGVSNFPVALLKQAEAMLPDRLACNQVEYHPFLSQNAVMQWTRSHGMFMTAFSPLARNKLLQAPEISTIANNHSRSVAQIALRWLMQQEGVVAIPKAAQHQHMLSNIAIFDFTLSPHEMQVVDALASPDGRLINPSWAPEWDSA
ncbi:MAG: aldo/keto reductase [Rickettsiales bacterium]|nr:aldo/keto reductase [Rickettsiales bacterium]